MSYECGTCNRLFHSGWRARDQHCDATGHRRPEFECHECDECFDDQEDLDNHMYRYYHWGNATEECNVCFVRKFSQEEIRKHERVAHRYCDECDRSFRNQNELNQHFNSNRHRQNGIQCPFCKETKGTATGLVHHLERGACPSAPLDRDEIYRQVRRRDPQGVISKHLIGWTGSVEYQATERSYNQYSDSYECQLCDRGFSTLHGLNQHLSSPVHQQSYYHCPKGGCNRNFATLAAMINHLESESCGFTTFGNVQNKVQNLVDPSRRIAF